ncbi:MAG: SGNH/GDSL hydrolase family protein [Bacteroidia bacterium]|nr:SGNH/GDSL hydrolase family protein [Bacteroidia bacterium]
MKIVILADSYGGPRIHNNVVEVNESETFPVIIQKLFPEHTFIVDYLSFRKMTDMPSLINTHRDADIIVIQSGIVDAYPRVISHERTISTSFFNKLIRKIIRMNRAFFIKYIRSKTWTSINEFERAISTVKEEFSGKLIWVNIAPVNAFQNKDTPGANESITRFNSVLNEYIKDDLLVDVHSFLLNQIDYEKYLHPIDSHLNVLGNKLYAERIAEKLKQIVR